MRNRHGMRRHRTRDVGCTLLARSRETQVERMTLNSCRKGVEKVEEAAHGETRRERLTL